MTINEQEYEVPVPFVFLSMVTFDKDRFVNVEVSSGTVSSQADSTFAIGYALPGVQDALGLGGYELTEDMELPEYVEIEADVTDFELEFTETIVANGFLADMEDDDLDDLRESGDSMDDLSEASDKLVSGTKTLYDSMVTYQGYLNQYIDGASQIQSGVDALEQLVTSADALAKNSADYAAGVNAYTGGVTAAYEGSKQLSEGVDTFVSSGSQLKDGMSGLVSGTNKLLSGIRTFDKEGIKELTKTFGTDLQEILDKVEALKQADRDYVNYAGIADDRTGSVMFMIETEELK